MPRSFNTAGLCRAEDDYVLPPGERLPKVRSLIGGKKYCVVHAPQRTGKTTALLALAEELTASGNHVAALLTMAVGAPIGDDPGAAELAILGDWWRARSCPVICSRRSGQPPVEARTSAAEAVTPAGRSVTVVRG